MISAKSQHTRVLLGMQNLFHLHAYVQVCHSAKDREFCKILTCDLLFFFILSLSHPSLSSG
jgi:hypothetical protein